MSLELKSQILDRILRLKDYSPFILICDSLAQTADYLLDEIERRKEPNREVVVLRDLNAELNIAQRIQQEIKPGVSVIGIYHVDDQLQSSNSGRGYGPSGLRLLEYMATSIIRIQPGREAQQRLLDAPQSGFFDFSGSIYNRKTFRVDIEHRRKTGRALTGTFLMDCEQHTSQFLSRQQVQEEELPESLTTFNLKLNETQRKNRENVELPFMEAQERPDGGGAIVYQFEKDDDYDEEDPYEDPF